MRRGYKSVIIILIFMCVLTFINLKFSLVTKEQNNVNSKDHDIRRETGDSNNDRLSGVFNQRDLHVYLVEEHHAVLKYWFDAVNQGRVPKEGNTLIHIDGHADLAMPFNTQFFPVFRRPRTRKDLEAMMQTNDVFIMGAAMSGLFKRVIWIFPTWDKPSHNNEDSFITTFHVGLSSVDGENPNESVKMFCTCYKNMTEKFESCSYTPLGENRTAEVIIPPSACDIHVIFDLVVINEEETVSFLTTELKDHDIILDIDEDYYGCVLPAQELVDVGINMIAVDQMNEILEAIMCPLTPDQEKKGDRLLYNVLEILKSEKGCRRIVSQSKPCLGVSRLQTAVDYLKHEIYDKSLQCPGKYYVLLRKLVSKLSLFTASQLTVLQSVGFCLSTMMPLKTSFLESTFGICHGNNVPGATVVLNHETNLTEITERTKALRGILKTLKQYSIPITTVCRSVRDGYTPRKYFHLIENDVISSLDVLERNIDIHYDPWLLGGKNGWYGRYENL